MLILLNILKAIAFVLNYAVITYMVVLFARVVLSWVRLPYSPITQVIYLLTEPVLRPIRRRLPYSLGIDFSPMIVFVLLIVFQMVVVQSLLQYAQLWSFRYLQ